MPSVAFTPTTPGDRLPLEGIFPPAEAADPSLFAPIWQWPPHWQCPMLGMGLSLGEQRRVFKRPQKTRHLGAYDLHQALMAAVGDENRISCRIDRLLRRKFQRAIAAAAQLATEAFRDRWQHCRQGQDGPGLFYLAAARRDLDETLRREIYGCVHMAGHTAALELSACRQEIQRQRLANVRLARTLRQLRQRHERQARHRPAQVAATPRTGGLVKASVPTSVKLTDARAAQERLQAEVWRLEREKRRLEIRYFELQAQNSQLAEEVRGLIEQVAAVATCRGDCPPGGPDTPICPRRVLIVGGMTKLHHLYRDLVQAAGGELDYHDGYLRQGGDNLQARIGRSDLVICPVSCNSHNACKRVKGICKRLNKPLHILPSASLSAITGALKGAAPDGEPDRVPAQTAN
jgi:hypothetical protein